MARNKELSKEKIFWFKAISVALPFIFVLLLEILLRAVGYGQDYPLFVSDPKQDGYLIMNDAFSEKYFTNQQNATIGFFEPFEKRKSPNTYRIFVLGASTAVGFPYFHNGSFHRMLRQRLERTYPTLQFEVINLALTAVNSYTLQDMAEQVIEQSPDAVLVYAGHNEYYGALGVGSTSRLGTWPALVRWSIAMRKWRIIQLIFSLYGQVSATSESTDLKENLMKRMVKEQAIPLHSPLYQKGIEQYEANMHDLLLQLQEAEIPTFISNLISNEKNLPPFEGQLQPQTDSLVWGRHFQKAKRAYAQKHLQAALAATEKALALDSTHAGAHFLQGQIYEGMGKPDKAQNAYWRAKEHDNLRFRAPEAINASIRSLASQHGAHYVDAEDLFRQHSPEGIIGESLILEHLHPNLKGYFLLSDAFYQALLAQEQIPASGVAIGTEEAWAAYPLTEVDSLYGAYGTLILKEGWPFYESFELDTVDRTLPEAIAGALAVKQISWEQAMEKLYQHYHQQEAYEKALTVLEGVLLEYPENAAFYAKAGSLCMRIEQFEKGTYFFHQAFKHGSRDRYAYFAAICLVQQGKLQESADYLHSTKTDDRKVDTLRLLEAIEQILSFEKGNENMSDPDSIIQLARNYLLVGLPGKAREKALETLDIAPQKTEALILLDQLDKQQKIL